MSEQFEHKVNELLGDIEIEPGSAVWQKVQQQIQPEKRRRRFIFWWLLPVVLAGGALTYFFMGADSGKPVAKADQRGAVTNISDPVGIKQQGGNPVNTFVTQQEPEEKPVASKVTIKTASMRSSENSNQQYVTPTKKQNASKQSTRSTKVVGVTKEDDIRTGSAVVSNKDAEATIADEKTSTDIGSKTEDFKPLAKEPVSTAKEQLKDTSVRVTSQIKNRLQPKKWRFGITADVGIANIAAVQNNNYAPVFNSGSSVSGPPITSGSFIPLKQKQHTNAGAQFGTGITIQRRINAKLDLFTALGYRYQSFSVRDIIYKDSANLQVVNYSSTSSYRIHQANLSFGANYYFINRNNNQFGLTAAFDNMYIVAANTNVATINSGVASFQKSNATGINRFQPYVRAGLVGSFTTNQNQVIQLSPYLRYGLRSFTEQRTGNKHVWQLGLNINYYFR